MPQPCSVPTMVSGAGAGWAQPLAQPETWTAMPSPEGGRWCASSRRERARRDQSRGAGRSPGTGDDAPARIARLRNETESLRRASRCRGVCLAGRSEQEDAVRRRPDPFGAIGLRDVGELYQRAGMGMAEGEPDPESKCAILLPVPAHRLGPRPRRQARCERHAIPCGGTEGGDAIAPQHIAGARFRTPRCDQLKKVHHGIGGGAGRDHAERCCRRGIARERHMECQSFCGGDGAQADVGRKRIKSEAAAAIDDHRDLRCKTKRGRCDGAAQIGGNGVGIEQCGGVVFKRIGDDGNALR